MPDPVDRALRLLDRLSRCRTGRTALGLALALSLVAVAGGRFNKHEHLVPAPPGDERAYAAYVEFFRGADVRVYPATSWRPLGPLLAAPLPLAPETALNIVNVVALLLALGLLYRTARTLGAGLPAAWIACALAVFSFPTFYYGAIGYVDPLAFLCIAAGLWCLVNDRWALFAAALALGVGAKETVALLLLPAAAQAWSRFPKGRAALLLAGLTAGCLAAAIATRWIVPAPNGPVFWSPSAELTLRNFGRARTWGSAALTFGLPGLLAAWRLARRPGLLRRPSYRVLAAGLAAAVATWAFALVSAPVDGRTLWPLYVFALPVVALWLEEHGARREAYGTRRAPRPETPPPEHERTTDGEPGI